jgi:hypothetical protein
MIVAELVLFLLCNGLYWSRNNSVSEKLYRVEAARVARDLQENAPEQVDLNGYETILAVKVYDASEICNNDYVIEEVSDVLYRIEYRINEDHDTLIRANIAMLLMTTKSSGMSEKILENFSALDAEKISSLKSSDSTDDMGLIDDSFIDGEVSAEGENIVYEYNVENVDDVPASMPEDGAVIGAMPAL